MGLCMDMSGFTREELMLVVPQQFQYLTNSSTSTQRKFTFERFSGGHELDKESIREVSAREVGKTLWGRWGFLIEQL